MAEDDNYTDDTDNNNLDELNNLAIDEQQPGLSAPALVPPVVDPLPLPPEDQPHIPLPDAIAMASPPNGPPVATIGMSPLPPQPAPEEPVQEAPAPLPVIPSIPTLAELSPLSAGPGYRAPASSVQQPVQYGPSSIAAQVNPYQYLLNKGQGLNSHGLNPVFAGRLSQAIQAAEAATGQRATLTDLYRSPETQAQYYANYKGHPVTFGGVTYNPQRQGGLAAAPGKSQHQQGTAADVSHGPVLDWLHRNAGQFGLEFLKGGAYAKDPVHIQLAGGGGRGQAPDQQPFTEPSNVAGSGYRAPASSVRSVGVQQPFGNPVQTLAQARQERFGTELQDPNVRRLLAASTQAEVGGQGPRAEQAYIESVMNRALSRGMSLSTAIQDPAYYPRRTLSLLGDGFGPDTQGRINNLANSALQGSNISNYATGNDSGRVHSGGAHISFNPGTGERFVHELRDLKWINSLGAYTRPMRDVGTVQPRGRQYAALDTGIRSDASPEPYEGAQYAELTPDRSRGQDMSDASPDVGEEDQTPYQMAQALSPPSRGFGLSQTLSQPNIETQNLQDYVKSLNLPASPVDLQPSSIPAQVPNFAGMAPPFHTVTVTGADGNPQSISVLDAMLDPTIGMTKGVAVSPEVLDRLNKGLAPTYEELMPSHFSDDELRSMSHEADKLYSKPGMPYTRRPLTAGEMAAIATLGLPIRAVQGFYHGAETAQDAALNTVNPYAHGPVGDFRDTAGSSVPTQDSTWVGKALGIGPMGYSSSPEDQLAAATTEMAMNVIGGRIPSATMETHALGVGGGGKFRYPTDPVTGRFIDHNLPPRPRGPDGRFLPDEAIEGATEAPTEPDKTGLSPVGQLLAEREAAKPELPPAPEATATPEPKLPPAPQLQLPKNRRMAGTNLRGLGLNPRAVAARKAAEEAAAAAKSPIDELNALKEATPGIGHNKPPPGALPELSDIKPGAPGSAAPIPPATAAAPRKAPRVPIVAKPGTVGPAAPSMPPPPHVSPAWPPPGYVEIDPEIVRQSQMQPTPAPTSPTAPTPPAPVTPVTTAVPPSPRATTPRVSQTPTGPAIPQAATPPVPDFPQTSFGPFSYGRIADDQTAPITSYFQKAGADQDALEHLKDTLRLHSGPQASALADQAAKNGHMQTPHVDFHVDTTIPEIRRYSERNPEFNDYVHAHDMLDRVQAAQRANVAKKNPTPGAITLHGYSESDLMQHIQNADQASPDFRRVHGLYKKIVAETRRMQSSGRFATDTTRNAAFKNAHHSNEVPYGKGERDRSSGPNDVTGKPIKRPNPIDLLEHHVRSVGRSRLTNEAVGQTVYALHNNPGSRGMFRPMTAAEVARTPAKSPLRRRMISFRQYGKTEHWMANTESMADLLRMDPYHYASGIGAQVMDTTRRLLVANTTGLFAHWFAVVDMLRNHLITQMNVSGLSKGMGPGRIIPRMTIGKHFGIPSPAFLRRPTSTVGIRQTITGTGLPLGPGTLPYAVMSQLVPRLVKYAQYSLNATSGGWLRKTFGPAAADHVAQILGNTYARSLFAQIEMRGSHAGGFLRQGEIRQGTNNVANAMVRRLNQTPVVGTSGQFYKNTVNAIHNATQFAFIQRNYGHVLRQVRKELGPTASPEHIKSVTLDRLYKEAGDVAGDPMVTGRAYTPSMSRSIGYDPGAHVTGMERKVKQAVGNALQYGWVIPNEFGRSWIPWHNMTMQGAKRFPISFLNNPSEYMARWATASILPAAASYWYNVKMGKDPQGIPYVDHMRNRRNERDIGMSYYFGLPNRPAAEGLEIPAGFQENSFAKMATEALMDHFHGNNIWNMGQDMQAAATSFLDLAVLPPVPPLLQTAYEAMGIAPPQNWGAFLPDSLTGGLLGQNTGNVDMGGDVYMRQGDRFIDSNRVLSQRLTSTLRSIMPAIADMTIAGYAAFEHTPEGLAAALENAAKASVSISLKRTPLLGPATGNIKPLTSATRVTQEMMNRDKAIKRILQYYGYYGMTGQHFIGSAKPVSKSGEAFVTGVLGLNHPAPESAGLNQKLPTNPMYVDFAKMLHDRFQGDALEKGGMGYKSLWRQYGEWGQDIRSLFNIDPGNHSTWQQQIQSRPTVMRELQNAGVDWKNPTTVRNYYENKRHNVARAINSEITAVERQLSEYYKRPIRIQDLDPYNAPGATDMMNRIGEQQGWEQGP